MGTNEEEDEREREIMEYIYSNEKRMFVKKMKW